MKSALVQLWYRKYIGQTIKLVISGVEPYIYEDIDVKSPIYLQILEEAAQNGLVLRFFLPRTRLTNDSRTDRLNVYLNCLGVIYKLIIE